MVEADRLGLHFQPNDPADLATQVEWLLSHPTQLTQMRREVRLEYESKYTARQNYQQLIKIYNQTQPALAI